MAEVNERWTPGDQRSEYDVEGLKQASRSYRIYSDDSELTHLSTDDGSPWRHLYQSLTPEEGVKAMDWVQALQQVEDDLEEEIEAFSIQESRCRTRKCTLESPLDSPLMRRRGLCCLSLNLS